MASFAFRVAGIEPKHDPAWMVADEPTRRAYWQAVVGFVKTIKDQELAAGLDRFGERLAPIAESTRRKGRWRSHTGMGSAEAPPLDPAYRLSRTRSLFDGRAKADHAEFFWRLDEVTGLPWGQVLAWHRAGKGRLPVRDVIGLSPASLARVKAKADAWWLAHKSGRKAVEAATTIKFVPQSPKKIVATGRTDLHNFTFGIGTDGERSRRAIEAGMATGFRQLGPRPAPPKAPATVPIPRPSAPAAPVVPRVAALRSAPVPKPAPPPRPVATPKAKPTPVVAKKPAPAPTPAPAPKRPGPIADTAPRRAYTAQVATEQDTRLKDIAAQLGTTPDAILAENRAKLKAAIGKGELYIRADSSVIKKILVEGRFKSQFETGTSAGTLDHDERSAVESEQFGVPETAKPESRPIYGYVSAPDFGSAYTRHEERVETYGDAVVRLKPSVRSRTTITVGDSLNVWGRAYASPATTPDPRSIPWDGLNPAKVAQTLQDADGPDEYLRALQYRNGYVEAQYQGGLSADEIEEIAFTFKPNSLLLEQLNARGIKWRVIARRDDD